MKPKYCFWSVCDGPYGAMMEHCVRSARRAGVFKEFHVLTDRPLEGCECYDAYQIDKGNGLFKLHYLKVGMSRLNIEYFVWLDADTLFLRNPVDLLGALGKSPLHVPLELSLRCIDERMVWRGMPLLRLRELFCQEGIVNHPYLSGSAFWIVHHDAIETVYELALSFWHKAKESGLVVDVSVALGYAMQILCADPESHMVGKRPDLWASDDHGLISPTEPQREPWPWRHPLNSDSIEFRPAIVHLPRSRPRFQTGLMAGHELVAVPA